MSSYQVEDSAYALAFDLDGADSPGLRFTYEDCAAARSLSQIFSQSSPGQAQEVLKALADDGDNLTRAAFDAAIRRLAPHAKELPSSDRLALSESLDCVWNQFLLMNGSKRGGGGASKNDQQQPLQQQRNGGVDATELSVGFALLCGGSKSDKLQFAWNLLDSNEDGALTRRQFWILLRSVLVMLLALSSGRAKGGEEEDENNNAASFSSSSTTAARDWVDDMAVEAMQTVFAQAEAATDPSSFTSQRRTGVHLTFPMFGDMYNQGGHLLLPFLELLDARKWPITAATTTTSTNTATVTATRNAAVPPAAPVMVKAAAVTTATNARLTATNKSSSSSNNNNNNNTPTAPPPAPSAPPASAQPPMLPAALSSSSSSSSSLGAATGSYGLPNRPPSVSRTGSGTAVAVAIPAITASSASLANAAEKLLSASASSSSGNSSSRNQQQQQQQQQSPETVEEAEEAEDTEYVYPDDEDDAVAQEDDSSSAGQSSMYDGDAAVTAVMGSIAAQQQQQKGSTSAKNSNSNNNNNNTNGSTQQSILSFPLLTEEEGKVAGVGAVVLNIGADEAAHYAAFLHATGLSTTEPDDLLQATLEGCTEGVPYLGLQALTRTVALLVASSQEFSNNTKPVSDVDMRMLVTALSNIHTTLAWPEGQADVLDVLMALLPFSAGGKTEKLRWAWKLLDEGNDSGSTGGGGNDDDENTSSSSSAAIKLSHGLGGREVWRALRGILITLLVMCRGSFMSPQEGINSRVPNCPPHYLPKPLEEYEAGELQAAADRAAMVATTAIFHGTAPTRVADDLVTLEELAEWYNNGGYNEIPWLELLDAKKWALYQNHHHQQQQQPLLPSASTTTSKATTTTTGSPSRNAVVFQEADVATDRYDDAEDVEGEEEEIDDASEEGETDDVAYFTQQQRAGLVDNNSSQDDDDANDAYADGEVAITRVSGARIVVRIGLSPEAAAISQKSKKVNQNGEEVEDDEDENDELNKKNAGDGDDEDTSYSSYSSSSVWSFSALSCDLVRHISDVSGMRSLSAADVTREVYRTVKSKMGSSSGSGSNHASSSSSSSSKYMVPIGVFNACVRALIPVSLLTQADRRHLSRLFSSLFDALDMTRTGMVDWRDISVALSIYAGRGSKSDKITHGFDLYRRSTTTTTSQKKKSTSDDGSSDESRVSQNGLYRYMRAFFTTLAVIQENGAELDLALQCIMFAEGATPPPPLGIPVGVRVGLRRRSQRTSQVAQASDAFTRHIFARVSALHQHQPSAGSGGGDRTLCFQDLADLYNEAGGHTLMLFFELLAVRQWVSHAVPLPDAEMRLVLSYASVRPLALAAQATEAAREVEMLRAQAAAAGMYGASGSSKNISSSSSSSSSSSADYQNNKHTKSSSPSGAGSSSRYTSRATTLSKEEEERNDQRREYEQAIAEQAALEEEEEARRIAAEIEEEKWRARLLATSSASSRYGNGSDRRHTGIGGSSADSSMNTSGTTGSSNGGYGYGSGSLPSAATSTYGLREQSAVDEGGLDGDEASDGNTSTGDVGYAYSNATGARASASSASSYSSSVAAAAAAVARLYSTPVFEFALPCSEDEEDDEGNNVASSRPPTILTLLPGDCAALQRVLYTARLDSLDSEAVLTLLRSASRGGYYLTRSAFTSCIGRLLPSPSAGIPLPDLQWTEAALQAIFSACDRSSTGTASVAEVACGLLLLCTGNKSQKLAAAWPLFDENNDGGLELSELTHLLSSFLTMLFVIKAWGRMPQDAISPPLIVVPRAERYAIASAAIALGDAAFAGSLSLSDRKYDTSVSFVSFGNFYTTVAMSNGDNAALVQELEALGVDAGSLMWLELLDVRKYPTTAQMAAHAVAEAEAGNGPSTSKGGPAAARRGVVVDTASANTSTTGRDQGEEDDNRQQAGRYVGGEKEEEEDDDQEEEEEEDEEDDNAEVYGYQRIPSGSGSNTQGDKEEEEDDEEAREEQEVEEEASSSSSSSSIPGTRVVYTVQLTASGDALGVTDLDLYTMGRVAAVSPLSRMSPDDIEELLASQVNSSGMLSRTSFVGVVAGIVQAATDNVVAAIGPAMDEEIGTANGAGIRAAARAAIRDCSMLGDMLLRLFELFDTDGQGTVDAIEFVPALMLLTGGSKSSKLSAAWRLRAGGAEGRLGRVDVASFLACFLLALYGLTCAGDAMEEDAIRDTVVRAASEASSFIFKLVNLDRGGSWNDDEEEEGREEDEDDDDDAQQGGSNSKKRASQTISYEDFASFYNGVTPAMTELAISGFLIVPYLELLDPRKWILPSQQQQQQQQPEQEGEEEEEEQNEQVEEQEQENNNDTKEDHQSFIPSTSAVPSSGPSDEQQLVYGFVLTSDRSRLGLTQADVSAFLDFITASGLHRLTPERIIRTVLNHAEMSTANEGMDPSATPVMYRSDFGDAAGELLDLAFALRHRAGSIDLTAAAEGDTNATQLVHGDLESAQSILDDLYTAFSNRSSGTANGLEVALGLALLAGGGSGPNGTGGRKSDKLVAGWQACAAATGSSFASTSSGNGAGSLTLTRAAFITFIRSILTTLSVFGRVELQGQGKSSSSNSRVSGHGVLYRLATDAADEISSRIFGEATGGDDGEEEDEEDEVLVTLDSFASFYNSSGWETCGFIELLDLSKWGNVNGGDQQQQQYEGGGHTSAAPPPPPPPPPSSAKKSQAPIHATAASSSSSSSLSSGTSVQPPTLPASNKGTSASSMQHTQQQQQTYYNAFSSANSSGGSTRPDSTTMSGTSSATSSNTTTTDRADRNNYYYYENHIQQNNTNNVSTSTASTANTSSTTVDNYIAYPQHSSFQVDAHASATDAMNGNNTNSTTTNGGNADVERFHFDLLERHLLLITASDVESLGSVRIASGLPSLSPSAFDAALTSACFPDHDTSVHGPIDGGARVTYDMFRAAIRQLIPGDSLSMKEKNALSQEFLRLYFCLEEYTRFIAEGGKDEDEDDDEDDEEEDGSASRTGHHQQQQQRRKTSSSSVQEQHQPGVPFADLLTSLLYLASGAKTEKLLTAFSAFDSDRDGALTISQFSSLVRSLLIGLIAFRSPLHMENETEEERETVDALVAVAGGLSDAVFARAVAKVGFLTFAEFGSFYNSGGFVLMPFIELLDWRKFAASSS